MNTYRRRKTERARERERRPRSFQEEFGTRRELHRALDQVVADDGSTAPPVSLYPSRPARHRDGGRRAANGG